MNRTPPTPLAVLAWSGFVATVWAANWAIGHYGIVDVGLGPWVFAAPAGLYFAGLGFGLRDVLHEEGGVPGVLSAIAVGAVLSAVLEGDARIAAASAVAFTASELADMAVYSPLRRRHWQEAVVGSNLVGAVVDSLLFLWIAGLPLGLWKGQVLGKALMILPVIPLMAWLRERRRRVCWACDGATDEITHTCGRR